MSPEQEEQYINFARSNTELSCREVPYEILEECSYAGDEPTQFISTFLETGHLEWLFKKHGHRHFEKERIARAVLVIWLRACDMYISQISGLPFAEINQMFFSDEGLY